MHSKCSNISRACLNNNNRLIVTIFFSVRCRVCKEHARQSCSSKSQMLTNLFWSSTRLLRAFLLKCFSSNSVPKVVTRTGIPNRMAFSRTMCSLNCSAVTLKNPSSSHLMGKASMCSADKDIFRYRATVQRLDQKVSRYARSPHGLHF